MTPSGALPSDPIDILYRDYVEHGDYVFQLDVRFEPGLQRELSLKYALNWDKGRQLETRERMETARHCIASRPGAHSLYIDIDSDEAKAEVLKAAGVAELRTQQETSPRGLHYMFHCGEQTPSELGVIGGAGNTSFGPDVDVRLPPDEDRKSGFFVVRAPTLNGLEAYRKADGELKPPEERPPGEPPWSYQTDPGKNYLRLDVRDYPELLKRLTTPFKGKGKGKGSSRGKRKRESDAKRVKVPDGSRTSDMNSRAAKLFSGKAGSDYGAGVKWLKWHADENYELNSDGTAYLDEKIAKQSEWAWNKTADEREILEREIPAAIKEMNAKYCFVEEAGGVYRKADGALISVAALNKSHNRRKVIFPGMKKEEGLASAWFDHVHAECVDKLVCEPSKPERFVNEDGQTCLNSWRQPGVKPINDPVLLQDLKDVFEHLTRHATAESKRAFMQFAMAPLRFKGVKMRWAQNVFSQAQGIGKGQVGMAIMQAHGRGGRVIDGSMLDGNFNGPLLGCTCAFLDEFTTGKAREVAARYKKIKRAISDPLIQLNPKGSNQFETQCMANFYIAGNEMENAGIEVRDRRHHLLRAPDEPMVNGNGEKDAAKYGRLGKAIDDGVLGGVWMAWSLDESVYPLTKEEHALNDEMMLQEEAEEDPSRRNALWQRRMLARVKELPKERAWTPEEFGLPADAPEPPLWNVNPGAEPPYTLSKQMAQSDGLSSEENWVLEMLSDAPGKLGPLYPSDQTRDLSNYWLYPSEMAEIYNHEHPGRKNKAEASYMGKILSRHCIPAALDKRTKVYLAIPGQQDMMDEGVKQARRIMLLRARRWCESLLAHAPRRGKSWGLSFLDTFKMAEAREEEGEKALTLMPTQEDVKRWAGEKMKLKWDDEGTQSATGRAAGGREEDDYIVPSQSGRHFDFTNKPHRRKQS